MRTFIFKTRVYFSDTDCGGIVYHARYLDFAEHARTEMLREAYGNQSNMMGTSGSVFVIKSITISFEKTGMLDDEITVESSMVEHGRFSAVFKQVVKRGDDILAVLSVKVACVNMSDKSIAPIPQDVLKALTEE